MPIRVRWSQVIDGEPSRVWSLLSSPEAWALRRTPNFMFNVPNAERLRLFIGPTRLGTGPVVYETCEGVPGTMISLRVPAGRQVFTLSVEPGGRGATKASAEVSEIAPRPYKIRYEESRRREFKAWLSALRAVIEGRAPWPKVQMPPDLRQKCLARPQIKHPLSASGSALIGADPGAVWDAVTSPETAAGSLTVDYSGHVPDTPRGEAGEMSYYIYRRADGQLVGELNTVTEITHQYSARVHGVGLGLPMEQHYLLTPESQSGATRLDLTLRWGQLKRAALTAEAATSQMSEEVNKVVSDYKSLVEEAANSE